MRTVEEIQKEYVQHCQKAGDMQYRIVCFQEELAAMNQRMRELNQEAIKLKEQETKEDGQTKEG